MSYSSAKGGWEVRWRDSTGRQRSRRFKSEETAREFDEAIHDHERAERRREIRHGQSGGVYPYETASGTRWRYVVRRSDGSQTSKRGFPSEKAARDARRRLVEKQERGEVRHTKETFGAFWERWLSRRKPYLEPGTWQAYERDGRLRLVPALGSTTLGRLDVEHVRGLMDEWVEAMEAEELAPKTINNTLGTLVVCLNAAVEDGLIVANPALRVPRLPPRHIEREYLRLHEIPLYLDSCSAVYRPLAELLIGSGLRISEALALDRLHGAHKRFLAGYAEWGGYRFHGWTHQTDNANYLGPVIWSEADCVLRFALELETDFPDQVHCEVKIDTSTRLDFPSDGENARQRVDIGVSDLSEFDAGERAYDAFRSLHHALFVEVKWFQKGWRDGPWQFDGLQHVKSVEADLVKLDRHLRLGRCHVAAMLIVDDEGLFEEHGADMSWPAGVNRLIASPAELRRHGISEQP